MELSPAMPSPVPLAYACGDSAPQVFMVRLRPDDHEALFAPRCSDARRAQARRYHQRDDRIRCLAAGWLLDYSAMVVTGACAVELKNSLGKPGLAHLPELHVSLAHAGEWVVCALHKACVGIDVEIEAEVTDGMAETFMSSRELLEYASMEGCAEKRSFFYRIWTMKEACLKATGTGMARSPDLIHLEIDDTRLRVTDCSESHESRSVLWHGFSTLLDEGSARLSLCWH